MSEDVRVESRREPDMKLVPRAFFRMIVLVMLGFFGRTHFFKTRTAFLRTEHMRRGFDAHATLTASVAPKFPALTF